LLANGTTSLPSPGVSTTAIIGCWQRLREVRSMSDERLDALGDYFVHQRILERYGVTFGRFIDLVEREIWLDYIS